VNTRIITPLILSSVALIALGMGTTRCNDEPPIRCGMASGNAIARYKMMGTPTDVKPNACAMLAANGYSLPVNGEGVGTEEYLPDQSNGSITNTVHRSMAIEPLWVINRIQDAELNEGDTGQDGGPGLPLDAGFQNYPYLGGNAMPQLPPADAMSTDRPYAWGFFDTIYPDSSGVCTAQLNKSDIVLPDVPAHNVNVYSSPAQGGVNTPQADQPATHIIYEWSEVKTVILGASVGQQLFANLTITQDDCQAKYQVSLLSPQVSCAVTDADGNVTGHDQSICSPTAVVNTSMPTPQQLYGSGLPVGVPVDCVDLNASAGGGGDGGGGGSASPDWECVPTKWSP
jgi:hypothetical protein